MPSSANPVTWWHDLQGGKIAEERPPPPGADQPYPNLSTVPPKPALPDRAAMASIASALVADRTNAQHVAEAAPIADPSSPSASPNLFGRGSVPPPAPPPPPGSQQASATMPAAEAPPAPPASSQPAAPPVAGQPPPPAGQAAAPAATPSAPSQPAANTPPPAPAKAPVGSVASAPLAPPGAAAQPPDVATAAPPALAAAPPPRPSLPGIAAASPQPAAPAAAPAAAPQAPVTPPANPADTVSVTFVDGSADLPSSSADTLKQLASRRRTGFITVTGHGDAATDTPDAQSAALALGLSRAKSMAAALTAAGIPASAVQIDASAIGRGGTAHLVQ